MKILNSKDCEDANEYNKIARNELVRHKQVKHKHIIEYFDHFETNLLNTNYLVVVAEYCEVRKIISHA